MEQILRFAKAHGFEAAQSGNEIIIEVPTYIPASRQSVILCRAVRTMDEARELLGY